MFHQFVSTNSEAFFEQDITRGNNFLSAGELTLAFTSYNDAATKLNILLQRGLSRTSLLHLAYVNQQCAYISNVFNNHANVINFYKNAVKCYEIIPSAEVNSGDYDLLTAAYQAVLNAAIAINDQQEIKEASARISIISLLKTCSEISYSTETIHHFIEIYRNLAALYTQVGAILSASDSYSTLAYHFYTLNQIPEALIASKNQLQVLLQLKHLGDQEYRAKYRANDSVAFLYLKCKERHQSAQYYNEALNNLLKVQVQQNEDLEQFSRILSGLRAVSEPIDVIWFYYGFVLDIMNGVATSDQCKDLILLVETLGKEVQILTKIFNYLLVLGKQNLIPLNNSFLGLEVTINSLVALFNGRLQNIEQQEALIAERKKGLVTPQSHSSPEMIGIQQAMAESSIQPKRTSSGQLTTTKKSGVFTIFKRGGGKEKPASPKTHIGTASATLSDTPAPPTSSSSKINRP